VYNKNLICDEKEGTLRTKALNKYDRLLIEIDILRLSKNTIITVIFIRFFKKLLFVLSLMLFLNQPLFSIIVLNVTIIASVMSWGVAQPFKWRSKYYIHVLGEILVLFYVDLLYCFTGYTDSEQKSLTG
jgi:hypothetical protein